MRKNYKNLLAIISLLILLVLVVVGHKQPISAASCDVAGLILNDTTWSPASCDPYIVTGNIIVDEDTTLTINPGTTIRFNSGLELTVRGTLITRGTSGNLITFTSNQISGADGDWTGIKFEDTSVDATLSGTSYVSGSIIQYAVIEYADNGIDLNRAYPLIDNSIIRFNHRGIYMERSAGDNDFTVTITNNSIVDNGLLLTTVERGGGIYSYRTQMYISDNIISRNRSTQAGGAIYYQGASGDVNVIEGNTITDNVVDLIVTTFGGGAIYASGGSMKLVDNLIQNNIADNSDGGGILFAGAAPMDIRNNMVFNNSAEYGGGFFFGSVSADADGMVINNSITNNVATISGGGVYSRLPNSDSLTFAYNDFYDNMANGQPNDFTTAEAASFNEDIVAINNWWGTTDRTVIENHITHAIDDADLGLVIFEPFCMAPCEPPETFYLFLPIIIR